MWMSSTASLRRSAVLAVFCGCWVAAGCSLLRPRPVARTPALAPTAMPQKADSPKPVATHRFQLDPDDGDLVGYVQKTVVGDDDTLPDIARRFDVGYEEMLLANPGVDPWLPGVGS